MKEILTNILLVIIGGLVVYSILTTATIKVDVKSFYDKIDNLQSKIDSAAMVNRELDIKIAKVDSSINLINNQISIVDNNINIIKANTNEKVNDVDTFTVSQLEKFFTDRYGTNKPQ
jgi:peptidoglycan hydrolase CwlO-like protein